MSSDFEAGAAAFGAAFGAKAWDVMRLMEELLESVMGSGPVSTTCHGLSQCFGQGFRIKIPTLFPGPATCAKLEKQRNAQNAEDENYTLNIQDRLAKASLLNTAMATFNVCKS